MRGRREGQTGGEARGVNREGVGSSFLDSEGMTVFVSSRIFAPLLISPYLIKKDFYFSCDFW